MNLTPKQLKTQEAILLRLYPGKRLEEIKQIELSYGCILMTNAKYQRDPVGTIKRIGRTNKPQECKDMSMYDIIGLPPTLPRVLDALGYGRRHQNVQGAVGLHHGARNQRIPRKLRNDDGTDATLWDQSIETQDAVSGLLGVE